MSFTASAEERPQVDVSFFRAFGFLVLRHFFDPVPISSEIDRTLQDGLDPTSQPIGYGDIRFQYVPMMTNATPSSLALLDSAESVAGALLGGPVLPTRAKAARYFGSTTWHTDSQAAIASVGFAAYLESLTAETGALRVMPGSHLPELGNALQTHGAAGLAAGDLPGYALNTDPGDLIVFDEHLFHASSGGGVRRQWRTDFLLAPVDARAEELTRSYFAGLYAPDWDGGYDVCRYPSYGPDWRASGRPSVAKLEALGVYKLAATQEAFMWSKRRGVITRKPS